MLKIGMIGAGFVAGFHERALRSVRDAEFAGVYAPKGAPELAELAKANRLGQTQVYESIAELTRAVDVVCVFAPNFARLDIMREIAKAVEDGAELKGIIIEKPLARNLKEADTLVRMAKALNVPTAYFENQIHMPAVVQARGQLAQRLAERHFRRTAERQLQNGVASADYMQDHRVGGSLLVCLKPGGAKLEPAGVLRACEYLVAAVLIERA